MDIGIEEGEYPCWIQSNVPDLYGYPPTRDGRLLKLAGCDSSKDGHSSSDVENNRLLEGLERTVRTLVLQVSRSIPRLATFALIAGFKQQPPSPKTSTKQALNMFMLGKTCSTRIASILGQSILDQEMVQTGRS